MSKEFEDEMPPEVKEHRTHYLEERDRRRQAAQQMSTAPEEGDMVRRARESITQLSQESRYRLEGTIAKRDINLEDFNWVAQQAIRAALSGAETLVQAFELLVREERFNEDEITEAHATLQNFLDTQGLDGTLGRPPQTTAPTPNLNEPKIVVMSDLLQHARDGFPEVWNQMSQEERSSHLHSTAREVSRILATFAGKMTPSEATSAAIELVPGFGEEADSLEQALLDEMDIQDEDYDAAHERFLLSFLDQLKQSE